MQNPKIFISYSHDSEIHKSWVLSLAIKLRQNGIDAILDLWDLRPGEDIARFMEEGILLSDKVLLICSDNYCIKSDEMKGGVGYEKLIVTGQMVKDLGTSKFIPLVRQEHTIKKLPSFLSTRLFIDFCDNSKYEHSFEILLRELLNNPLHVKPPLGINPFIENSTTIINQIIPFEHINGIKPRYTKYSDVLKLFGRPSNSIYTQDNIKLINYIEMGLTIIIDEKNDATDPIVDSLFVEYPFDGKSINGLFIGMPQEEALKICSRYYFKKGDYGDSQTFSKLKDSYDSFQLWFNDDILIRMKLFPE
jgi:hypothetical protein